MSTTPDPAPADSTNLPLRAVASLLKGENLLAWCLEVEQDRSRAEAVSDALALVTVATAFGRMVSMQCAETSNVKDAGDALGALTYCYERTFRGRGALAGPMHRMVAEEFEELMEVLIGYCLPK